MRQLAALDRKHALVVLGTATVAFTVILELIDPSHVSHGPTILDFEFAGSQSRAAQIASEWGAQGRSAARLSLVLDSSTSPTRCGSAEMFRSDDVILVTREGTPAGFFLPWDTPELPVEVRREMFLRLWSRSARHRRQRTGSVVISPADRDRLCLVAA